MQSSNKLSLIFCASSKLDSEAHVLIPAFTAVTLELDTIYPECEQVRAETGAHHYDAMKNFDLLKPKRFKTTH